VADAGIHPEAEKEYERALGWYLERSVQAADRFQAAFDEAIERIHSNPSMFPLCDEVHRFILLKRYPYGLVYRLDGDSVQVIAVAHTRRRLRYWSGRS
jgi:plasmid stabilization system protein ParE